MRNGSGAGRVARGSTDSNPHLWRGDGRTCDGEVDVAVHIRDCDGTAYWELRRHRTYIEARDLH
jgi:hypothetical protein